MGIIGIIVWLLVGGLVGWLTSIITKTQQNRLRTIGIGSCGGVLGAFVAYFSGFSNSEGLAIVNVIVWMAAIVGAVGLLWVTRRASVLDRSRQLSAKHPGLPQQTHTSVNPPHPQPESTPPSSVSPAQDPQPQAAASQTVLMDQVVWQVTTASLPSEPNPQSSVQRVPAHPIFISYRRGDTADVTGRIYDRLVQRFGGQAVFKDVDSIPFGIDFRKALSETIGQCSILIAVIGQKWLTTESAAGKRRLDDPRDFVRIEIEAALQRDIPIIPLLVQGAAVPPEEELPPSLQGLTYRNGMEIRPDPDFHTDMNRLIRGIEIYVAQQ